MGRPNASSTSVNLALSESVNQAARSLPDNQGGRILTGNSTAGLPVSRVGQISPASPVVPASVPVSQATAVPVDQANAPVVKQANNNIPQLCFQVKALFEEINAR